MNTAEASTLLETQLTVWRARAYGELVAAVGTVTHLEIPAPSGARYQIDVEVVWDDVPRGPLRLIASIDDGGVRALFPLCRDALIYPPL